MDWGNVEDVLSTLPIPESYSLEHLTEDDIKALTRSLREWYPDLVAGSEARYLNVDFYKGQVYLNNGDEARDILAVGARHADGSLVAILILERDVDEQTLCGPYGVVSPNHRIGALGLLGPLVLEAFARSMGAGLAYYHATLRSKHQQIIAERLGFDLVGIVPAKYRVSSGSGVVTRLDGLLYAKVLAAKEEVYVPKRKDLTRRTIEFWERTFNTPLAD